jgi:hypothetical protein
MKSYMALQLDAKAVFNSSGQNPRVAEWEQAKRESFILTTSVVNRYASTASRERNQDEDYEASLRIEEGLFSHTGKSCMSCMSCISGNVAVCATLTNHTIGAGYLANHPELVPLGMHILIAVNYQHGTHALRSVQSSGVHTDDGRFIADPI